MCTSFLSAASLGPRPRSDSSLIPPTFCVEMMMDCSCGDGWIVACVDALGVIFYGMNARVNYAQYIPWSGSTRSIEIKFLHVEHV